MKNLFLNIGIAFVSMTTVCNAASNLQLSQITNPLQNEITTSAEKGVIQKPVINEEVQAFNPETVIPYQATSINEIIIENDKITENKSSEDIDFINYVAAMKEVVAQTDLITENTESNEVYPLNFYRNIQEEITQLDLITENTINEEIRPLDFKKINKNTINSVFTSKTFVGMN